MEQAIRALLQSQAELQNAMKELLKKIDKDEVVVRAPGGVLTKQSPDDDIEAYLELFERTATRERWPPGEWAGIIASFLIGEAQHACRDLPAEDARDYPKLKAAILASHGYSLPARAQRYHAWAYCASQPPRAQLAELLRLTQGWLTSGGETPWIQRLVIDRCIRAFPPDARKYAAQVSPASLDSLVALLENYQVSNEMLRTTRAEPSRPTPAERMGRERRRSPTRTPPRNAPRDSNPPERLARPPRRCYVCGREGHISWACPERDRDVSMPSSASSGAHRPCLHTGDTGRPLASLPVRVGGTDAHALIDSGSVVTLVRADYAGPVGSDTVPVTCVHGDVRHYPVSHIRVQTPRGDAVVAAGVVPNLPVPLLIGTDCVLFQRYWNPGRRRPHPPRQTRRRDRRPAASTPRTAFPTFRAPRGTSPGSRASERDASGGETPPASEDPFSEFPLMPVEGNPPQGEYATAQWADPNLERARQSIATIDGQLVTWSLG
ncbi:uncharacterized protein LOC133654391 [Entelurus aequoreus]|uniref:uncharacterized protein LOC133654391 n=1 Tax=Entelurus aequoreus TaxID=161455 RepID=UPI002B1DCBF4|nr:uncharacterized protein LOC133654391 [Entelurus aequoreus]